MGINLSESEWCRKSTPEVPCRTQGFSHRPRHGLEHPCFDCLAKHVDEKIDFLGV